MTTTVFSPPTSFVWEAEMQFFHLWWEELTSSYKSLARF